MKRKITKKAYSKMKSRLGVDVHYEGKYPCNCLIRKYRYWLGKKLGLHKDE